MKCLVTGNHGYIGHIMTNRLLEEGHDVRGWDCDYFPPEKCFGREEVYKTNQKIAQIGKDLRDVTPKDLEGTEAVIHLAALPNDWACDIDPKATYDINHLTALQLAIAAKRAGVERFVFASSCSVFGVKGNELINEGDSPAPISPYGFSKMKAEKALLDLDSEDFSVTCMRNATCYGVSPRMRFDMVLNNLVGWAFTTGTVNMYLSDGTSWRPLVHIEDVANAYAKSLELPKPVVASQVFSIGTENFIIKDLAEIVKQIVPGAEVKYAPDAPKDLRSYKVNFSKMERMLGVKPGWDVERGAKELYDAYKKVGLTLDSFKKTPRYWAGDHFRKLKEEGRLDQNFRLVRTN